MSNNTSAKSWYANIQYIGMAVTIREQVDIFKLLILSNQQTKIKDAQLNTDIKETNLHSQENRFSLNKWNQQYINYK